MPPPIVLAHIPEHAHLAPRHAGHTDLAAVMDEVKVEAIIDFRRNERTEQLVRFFIRGVFGNPTEALGDASDVRVHWEGWHSKCEEQDNRRGLGSNALDPRQPAARLFYRHPFQEIQFKPAAFASDVPERAFDPRRFLT